jgi:uncharacterized protein (DUF849 family)
VPVQACLNGDRSPADHPACPLTPAQLAADAVAVARAGANGLHVHPRDEDGAETLAPEHVAAAVTAITAAVALPVGVTTGAWVAPDPADRVRAVRSWAVLPEVASVNLHEEGAVEVCRALLEQGVGIEAGIWTPAAAETLVAAGVAPRCVRILLEPMDEDVDAASRTATAIEAVLDAAGTTVPRLLHGTDATTWPMLELALRRGHQARIGLEDTLHRPDGSLAAGTEELVRLAAEMAQGG